MFRLPCFLSRLQSTDEPLGPFQHFFRIGRDKQRELPLPILLNTGDVMLTQLPTFHGVCQHLAVILGVSIMNLSCIISLSLGDQYNYQYITAHKPSHLICQLSFFFIMSYCLLTGKRTPTFLYVT